MKTYKVYGSEITKSRCGAYVYNLTDRIEAESAEEAAKIYKENHKAPAGRRWSVRVNKVVEVEA
jgi:DNA-binding transcriptional regulator PaaX